MRVIQLSDPHVEPQGVLAYRVADSATDWTMAVRHVAALIQPPDAVVVTGDLASSGNPTAYAIVRDALEPLRRKNIPVYVLPGNHDHRPTLLEYLGDYCPTDPAIAPWLCYTVEASPGQPMRLIIFDSAYPGSHAGHLQAQVAQWLDAALAQAPSTPTLLFTHHPPFLSGMGAMDEHFENVHLLKNILRQHPQVRLCCGHMHRAFTTLWAGRLCQCAPSTTLQLDLNLSLQGGDDFCMEAPGYLLHHWHKGQCNSHVCQIPGQYDYSGPHPFVGIVNPE